MEAAAAVRRPPGRSRFWTIRGPGIAGRKRARRMAGWAEKRAAGARGADALLIGGAVKADFRAAHRLGDV